jgi:transposase-like protein
MKLSPQEQTRLEQLCRSTKNVDEHNRCSVVLGVDNGYSMEVIAEILGISRSSAYNYHKEFEESLKTINLKSLGRLSFLDERVLT